MTTQRVITSAGEKTSHYTGVNYQYFFTKSPQKGNTCKMQIAKSVLEEFEKAKGRINSLGMIHLQVLDQGNGWWLICSDQPENDGVVTEFIARFNRWALKRAARENQTVVANVKDAATSKARYTIEVRTNHNGRLHRPGQQRLSSAQPIAASEGSLQDLAETINARFGHTKRK
jgi:hypothetical protein